MDMRKQDGITLIEKIATPRNLVIACEKVYKNKGAAGIDGITVQEIDEHMAKYQKAIIAKLLPRFPKNYNVVGGTTPKVLYNCDCFFVISPTRTALPGFSNASMTSNSSSNSCIV